MGWFVGQVMKKMRGKADPQLAKQNSGGDAEINTNGCRQAAI